MKLKNRRKGEIRVQAKVVIIDDNPVTVRSLTKTIDWEGRGCVVAGTASDGETGRELCLSVRPDILLLDIRMPQKNGLEMLDEIRDELPECKVIIITGAGRAFVAGADISSLKEASAQRAMLFSSS